MTIKFTPAAQQQLALVTQAPANPTGFIMGMAFGRFKIIDNVFPIHFDPSTINELYATMYSQIGNKLLGVFFNHSQPFLSDWFIEDIVLCIQDSPPRFYYYDAEKQFIPLPWFDANAK